MERGNLVYSILSQNAFWVVNKTVTKIIGLEASFLLSDLITKNEFFSKQSGITVEWFFNTAENIEEDTTLTYFKQKKALEVLLSFDLIETKRKGIPAKMYFKINHENVLNIIKNSLKQDIKEFNNLSLNSLITINNNKVNNNKKETKTSFSSSCDESHDDNDNNNSSILFGNNFPITNKMFDQFWTLYPKKAGKGNALTTWNKLCTKKINERPAWKIIRTAVLQQKKSEQWQNPKYIPHPTTWLNQSRWLDDPNEMKNFKSVSQSSQQSKQTGYVGPEPLTFKKSIKIENYENRRKLGTEF